MSPRAVDPDQRITLIETAARLIAEHGPDGLTIRRLAREVGTSTMAIYTHFGSMPDLRRAVRREGFSRLGARMRAVEETGDALADLALLSLAYVDTALHDPNLYRAMFLEGPIDLEDAEVGVDTFEMLVRTVDRCMTSGRFDRGDATRAATHLWAYAHGLVTLHLASLLPGDELLEIFGDGGLAFFKALGDDPQATGRSLATARRRLAPFTPVVGSA